MASSRPENTTSYPSPAAFDFESYRQQAIKGLMGGKTLTGEQGLLKPLIANFTLAVPAVKLKLPSTSVTAPEAKLSP